MSETAFVINCPDCLYPFTIYGTDITLTPRGISFPCRGCGEVWKPLTSDFWRSRVATSGAGFAFTDGPVLRPAEVEGFADWLDTSPDPARVFFAEVADMS